MEPPALSRYPPLPSRPEAKHDWIDQHQLMRRLILIAVFALVAVPLIRVFQMMMFILRFGCC
jgi:hypothetical protein